MSIINYQLSINQPRVSVLIPTLNAARTLPACLASIRKQNYPRECLEIILADAGSTDETRAVAQHFGVDRIVENPLKTGEAGKSAAAEVATGEILALIDSDNILPDATWLSQMVAPFNDKAIFASEPLEYTWRAEDPALTRYFALLGMNDPLCLFIGNYDRISAITGKWTALPCQCLDSATQLTVTLNAKQPIPTIGANGFLIRKAALANINRKPYWFDVDIVRDYARQAPDSQAQLAKVKCGIVHLYCDTLDTFARKQERRVRDFLYFSDKRVQEPIPGEKKHLILGILKFSLATCAVVPLLLQRKRGQKHHPDPEAWKLHVTVCRITLRTYALGVLRKLLGFKQAPASRDSWKQ